MHVFAKPGYSLLHIAGNAVHAARSPAVKLRYPAAQGTVDVVHAPGQLRMHTVCASADFLRDAAKATVQVSAERRDAALNLCAVLPGSLVVIGDNRVSLLAHMVGHLGQLLHHSLLKGTGLVLYLRINRRNFRVQVVHLFLQQLLQRRRVVADRLVQPGKTLADIGIQRR